MLSAFAPVLSMAVPKPAEATLTVALPNGVKLELQGVGLTDLSPLLNDLAALPKMRCFKLLGERVNARLFNSQVAELQIRAALLNRFTQLGTPITMAIP